MKKCNLIIFLLFLSVFLFAQNQKSGLSTLNKRGSSFIVIGGLLNTSGHARPNHFALYVKGKSIVWYQYNLINRLSIGGGIGTEFRYLFKTSEAIETQYRKNLDLSVFVNYHPFKSNGIFLEGEFTRKFAKFENSIRSISTSLSVNPGYTFMIGKNRRMALDLKTKIYLRGNIAYMPFNSLIISLKIPI